MQICNRVVEVNMITQQKKFNFTYAKGLDYSANYINFSINVLMSWMSKKSIPCYSSSLSDAMMHKVNRELKAVLDYADRKCPLFFPMPSAVDDRVLSVESVCWIAQSYGMIDRMKLASRGLTSLCIHQVKPLLNDDEYKILHMYASGIKPLNYRVLNKLRYKVKAMDNPEERKRLEHIVEAFFCSELYLDKSCIKNAYSLLYKCYKSVLAFDPMLLNQANEKLKDIFKR